MDLGFGEASGLGVLKEPWALVLFTLFSSLFFACVLPSLLVSIVIVELVQVETREGVDPPSESC